MDGDIKGATTLCDYCARMVVFKKIITPGSREGKILFDIRHPKLWLPVRGRKDIYSFKKSISIVPHRLSCDRWPKNKNDA